MAAPDRANDPKRKPTLDMPGWIEMTPEEWSRGVQAKLDAKANKPAKQKAHTHVFDESHEEVVGPNPNGSTVLPCSAGDSIGDCTAELHPGYEEKYPQLHHNGTVTDWKGGVTPRPRRTSREVR